jgi:hypothetical protein
MLKSIPSENLVFVDECGIDQYLYREFAYSPRGQKVAAKSSREQILLQEYVTVNGLRLWNTAELLTVLYLNFGLKIVCLKK